MKKITIVLMTLLASWQAYGKEEPTNLCEEDTKDPSCLVADASIGGVDWLLARFDELDPKHPAIKQFVPLLKEFRNYADTRNKFITELSLSYAGEKTGEGHPQRNTGNIDVNITYDTFPIQHNFNFEVKLKQDNDAVSDTLSKFGYKVDFYIGGGKKRFPEFEGFAFVERQNIDQMLIDQRYEIGGGLKVEFNLGLTGIGEQVNNFFADNPFDYDGNVKHGDILPNVDSSKNMSTAFSKAEEKFTSEYLEKKEICKKSSLAECTDDRIKQVARWLKQGYTLRGLNRVLTQAEVGISLAVLQDYTKASVELMGAENSLIADFKGKTFKEGLKSDNTLVYSLRPKIKYHITDRFYVEYVYFYKFRRDDGNNHRKSGANYYTNTNFNITYLFSKDIGIALSYKSYFDNAPYYLTVDDINASAPLTKVLSPAGLAVTEANKQTLFSTFTAPSRYESYALEMKIKF